MTLLIRGATVEKMGDEKKGSIGCWLVLMLPTLLAVVHPIFIAMIVIPFVYFGLKAKKWNKEQERLRMEELARPIE